MTMFITGTGEERLVVNEEGRLFFEAEALIPISRVAAIEWMVRNKSDVNIHDTLMGLFEGLAGKCRRIS